MNLRRWMLIPCTASALLGAALLGEQAWLAAKGELAERLIARAWVAHRSDGGPHRPWGWADTWPLGRLEVPRLGVEQYVLAGASGSSLAFGPGLVDGTSPLNGDGLSVVAGHRDGAFAFLRRLRPGDEILLETAAGRVGYRVRSIRVHSMWDAAAVTPSPTRRLALVTCWPFDGLTRSDRRLVVLCDPVRS